ncbi:MAG TPA: hypothetical protein VE907_18175 [Gammaproteobacteria bacterium]|nr:hypothetical protein [Gammaproteobacteria bacterium]
MQSLSPKRRGALRLAVVLAGALPVVLFVAGSRVHAQAPAPKAPAPAAKIDAGDFNPTATIIEIMDSMVMPSAQILWDAVAVDVSDKGTVEKTPQTDEDWQKLRWTAVTLAEATNVLVLPGRKVAPAGTKSANPDSELEPAHIQAMLAKDRGAWVAHAKVLHAAAMEMIKAIDTKSIDGVSDAGGTLDSACEGCHLQFWYPNQKQ